MGMGIMISMFGGKLRCQMKGKLCKLEGFHNKRNTRLEITESGNVTVCNQHGSGEAPPRSFLMRLIGLFLCLVVLGTEELFRSLVAYMSKELLAVSAKSQIHGCKINCALAFV